MSGKTNGPDASEGGVPRVVAAHHRRGPGEGRVYQPSYRDRKTRKLRRVSTWFIRYRDATGKEVTEKTKSRDRRVAIRLLNERLHAIRAGERKTHETRAGGVEQRIRSPHGRPRASGCDPPDDSEVRIGDVEVP